MTAFANLMAGVGNRPRCDLGDGIAPVVSVFSKAARHKKAARHEEQNASREKDRCQTENMTGVFEYLHNSIRNELFCRPHLTASMVE